MVCARLKPFVAVFEKPFAKGPLTMLASGRDYGLAKYRDITLVPLKASQFFNGPMVVMSSH